MITVQLIPFKGYGSVIWFRGFSPNPIIKDKTRGIYFSLFHRAFHFTKFYLYQRMHLFLSYTKIT